MNHFSQNVLNKILAYLTTKEGFTLDQETQYFRDSMGFWYKIEVTPISRDQTQRPDVDGPKNELLERVK